MKNLDRLLKKLNIATVTIHGDTGILHVHGAYHETSIWAMLNRPAQETLPPRQFEVKDLVGFDSTYLNSDGQLRQSSYSKVRPIMTYGVGIPTRDTALAEDVDHVKRDRVKRELKKALYAMSTDPLRGAYHGMMITEDSRVVATDGHRLAIVGHSGDLSPGYLPADAITAIMTSAGTAKLSIGRDNNKVHVRIEENGSCVDVLCHPTPHKYPDYQRVLKHAGETTTCKILVAGLKGAVSNGDTVSIVLRDPASAVEVRQADRTVSIPAEIVGQGKKVILNSKYLLDALKQLSGVIQITVQDDLAPVFLDGENGDCHIIMPMKE